MPPNDHYLDSATQLLFLCRRICTLFMVICIWFIGWPWPKQEHLDIRIDIHSGASSIAHDNNVSIALVNTGVVSGSLGGFLSLLQQVQHRCCWFFIPPHRWWIVAMQTHVCAIETSCPKFSHITAIVRSLHWQHWQQIVNSNWTQWTNTLWKHWFVIKNSVWTLSPVNIFLSLWSWC